MELGLAVDVAVKAAVLGLSVYPLVRPGSSHFAGKAMGVRGDPLSGDHPRHPDHLVARRTA